MAAQRPTLETVLETEVFIPNSSKPKPITPVDDCDFWSDKSEEANPILLEKLLESNRKVKLAEDRVADLESIRENEMKFIIARLLLLEGNLVKDKKTVERLLAEKDRKISLLTSQLSSVMNSHSLYHMDCVDNTMKSPRTLFANSNVAESSTAPITKQQPSTADPGNYTHLPTIRRCNDSAISPLQRFFTDVEIQTEEFTDISGSEDETNNQVEIHPRELRSYSNPDDFEQAYSKTSEARVSEKNLIHIVNETNVEGPNVEKRRELLKNRRGTLTRKKSLSSPDLQVLLAEDGSIIARHQKNDSNNNHGLYSRPNCEDRHIEEQDNSADNSFDEPNCFEFATSPRDRQPNTPTLVVTHAETEVISNPPSALSSMAVSPSKPQARSTKSLLADPLSGFRFPALTTSTSSIPLASSAPKNFEETLFMSPTHRHVQSLRSSPVDGRRRSLKDITSENFSKSSSVRQSNLLRRPMLFLRSYSTPTVVDVGTAESHRRGFTDKPAPPGIPTSRGQVITDDKVNSTEERSDEEDNYWVRSQHDSAEKLLHSVAAHLNDDSLLESPIYF